LAGSGQLENTYHKVVKLLERPDERLLFNGRRGSTITRQAASLSRASGGKGGEQRRRA
jgi:hypothetical protein